MLSPQYVIPDSVPGPGSVYTLLNDGKNIFIDNSSIRKNFTSKLCSYYDLDSFIMRVCSFGDKKRSVHDFKIN
jgi:hypothetical protein